MIEAKKYYFASDVHMGLPSGDARARERRFVRWLDSIKQDAAAIFLLGDIFDFWCEYKEVVPRGFVRTLGKLAELTDSGIEVHFFAGNHDLWFTDYLPTEIGVVVHRSALTTNLYGKTFYLSHGDEINADDPAFRFKRSLFTSKFLQAVLRMIHPRWILALAHRWSQHSRLSKGLALPFRGDEEAFVQFVKQYETYAPIDYFVFGHRHTPMQLSVGQHSQLVILGEWIHGGEYGVFDGEKMELHVAAK